MKERPAWKINGFIAVALIVLLAVFTVLGVVYGQVAWVIIGIILMILIGSSLVLLQPNVAAVITFFGRYKGVIRESGIWMIVPFSSANKISLRIRNFNSERLKVNDINGNPIEIATVVVFRVVDAAKATFDVENYKQFVEIQSETALRHVAARYPYDNFEESGISLRGNTDEISKELLNELRDRLDVAGVEVLESRLTHLAYATEIASAMLQRQQAAAILAARKIIVEGAVGMAQMAITRLENNGVMDLDDERRINMINNLMVAIISDRSATPVINVGSLY
ncbi:MAG: SPFH domain-containing protein [Bacillota bacterium]|jgi:regulator of protease activity HflC (stomatin/prohibitin superfamily)